MSDGPDQKGLKESFPKNVTPMSKYEHRRGEQRAGNPLVPADVSDLNFKVEELTDPEAFMDVLRMMNRHIGELQRQLENKDQQIDLLAQENTHLENEIDDLKKVSKTDALTGLVNEATFKEELEETISRIERGQGHFDAALIYIDLIKFKQINDTYGHAAGDQALKIMAGHLENFTREYEHAARLHGDEFALIVSDDTGLEEDFAIQACQRLADHLDGLAFEWDGQTIPIGASLGVTAISPYLTVEENLDRADQSMYVAKRGHDAAYSSRKAAGRDYKDPCNSPDSPGSPEGSPGGSPGDGPGGNSL